jgi:pSer/pThr/pTyr-binding forkhead associated (FHA) protein
MRLAGHRYTFGSAEGCSIQLSDPDLSPMHAVLMRTGNRTIVRAYSVPVMVNQRSVTEAELQLGDVLQLGVYQFELCGAVSDPSEETTDAMIRVKASDQRKASLHARQTESAHEAEARMREQFDQLNQQIEELSAQQIQIETREQVQRTELEQQIVQLRESHKQAVEQQSESETARLEAEAQLDRLQSQLARADELHCVEMDRLRHSLAECESEVESLRQTVLQLQQTLEASTEALSRAQDELNELHSTNLQLTARIDQETQQVTRDPQLSSIWRDQEWDQERLEESCPIEGASDSDEFRLEELEEGQYDFIDDAAVVSEALESNTEEESSSTVQGQASQFDRPSSGFADADGEDDSIEAYMNRLLRRVQGKPLEEVAAPVAPPPAKASPPVEAAEPPKATKSSNRLDPNVPLVPRSQAPEKGSSLSAMRELANASARIAINRSVQLQTRDTQLRAAFSFACAVGAAVCGIACFLLLPGIMRYLSAVMTAVVATIYLYESWKLYREASRRLNWAEREPSETANDD